MENNEFKHNHNAEPATQEDLSSARTCGIIITLFFGLLLSLLFAYTVYPNREIRLACVKASWRTFFTVAVIAVCLVIFAAFLFFVIRFARF